MVEIPGSASLMTTKVAPQMIAQIPSARSARKRGLIGVALGSSAFDACERSDRQEQALEAEFPSRGIVPLVERVRPAAAATAANRDRGNAHRERNVCVG